MMDKLTKTFQAGEVLKAQDLNNVKDKVNELVDNANAGGSGGTGGSITIDSSLSTTSTNPAQNKVVTEELNKKVDKADGKGLSANDYTDEDRQKLAALPEQVYAVSDTYSKEELDRKLSDKPSGILSISSEESVIGSFKMGMGNIDIYERAVNLFSLPVTTGESKDFVIADEPLGYGLYFSVESFSASSGKGLTSSFFNFNYKITGFSINSDLQSVVTIECVKAVSLTVNAVLNIRYCKFLGDVVKFEVELPEGVDARAVNLTFPTLKYDKKIAFSYINDDSYTIWNNIFCRVNKKWVCDEIGVDPWKHEPDYKFFFHYGMPEGAYESTGFIPDKPLEYTDGCGVKHRFASSVATWVDKLYDPKDSSDIDMPYGLTMPYNSALESRIMFDFGYTVNWHDVFDSEDIRNQETFDRRISEKSAEFKRLVGLVPKVMVEPNGEHDYLVFAQENPLFVMNVAQSGTGIELVYPFKSGFTLDKNEIAVKRVFTSGTDEEYVSNMIATLTQYRNASDKSTVAWMIGAAHRNTSEGASMFTEIESRWGCSGDDSVWFPSVDEFFEYWFMTKFAAVGKSIDGQKVRFSLYMPSAENFWFKSISCLLSGISSAEGITLSSDCQGQSVGMSDGKLLVNLDFNPELVDKVERYVSAYEKSANKYDYEDAAYFIQHLKESLQQPYLSRLEAVSNPVDITGLSLDKSSLNLAGSVSQTLYITALPVDNTQMDRVTYTLRGIDNINITLNRNHNIVTATITNTNKVAGTYDGFIKFAVKGTDVVSEEIPVQVVVESSTLEKPVTSLQLECAATISEKQPLSCTCSALPADNTDMSGIVISTTGNVADKAISGNILTFNVTWPSAKVDTVTVSVGGISSSKTVTINAVDTPSEGDDNIACFAAYSWTDHKSAHITDSLYGGSINYEAGNYGPIANGEAVYSKSGKILNGWSRAGDEQENHISECGEVYQAWMGPPAQSGSVADVFSTDPVLYQSVSRYNAKVANCLRYQVPNGSYKVRFLSSTTESGDVYTNAVITINGVDRTSAFPTSPYAQKQEWTDYIDVTVTDGRITIMLVVNPSKRVGFNAIEIKKIS